MKSNKKPTYKELEDEISKLKLQYSIQKEKKNDKATLTEDSEFTLLEHGQNLGLLFKNMPSAFVYAKIIYNKNKAIDFEFIEVNDAFDVLTGYLNVVGKRASEFMFTVKGLDAGMLEMISSEYAIGIPKNLEYYISILDKWILVKIFSPKKDYFIAVYLDITVQKKEEEKRIKTEEKKRPKEKEEETYLFSTFSNMGEPVFVKDNQSKFVFVNNAFCVLFNLKRAQIIGKTFVNRYTPEEQDLFLKIDRQVILHGQENIEEELLTLRNDQIRTIATRKTRFINSEGKRFLIGIIHDITERYQAENKFKVAELKLKKIKNELTEAQKLIHAGSWTFNITTQKSEWSDETFHIWGFDSKKGAPDFKTILNRIHPDDVKSFHSAFTKTTTLGLLQDIEFRICLPNGEQKVIRGIYTAVLAANGKIISVLSTSQDITKQKLFTKDLVNLQRLEAISEMSSSIAHDFNNSLQSITGNLEIIKLQNNLSETSRERLNNIEYTIKDVFRRVHVLQYFGSTEHMPKNTEPIHLNKLVQESLKQFGPLWKGYKEKEGLKINITTDFGDIPAINCNKKELKIVLHNLIKNSVEAIPKNGTIHFKTSKNSKNISLTITDTGIGMAEETKLKVFQPFYSTKGLTAGRGLGMSRVYNIVKKHKGNVFVKSSELRKGTTIEILLPINLQQESKNISEKKQAPRNKTALNILWVDDDIDIRENSSELLELIGYNCNHAASGKDALEYLNKNTCDIVFTDIGMPEMNGWELTSAIKQTFGEKIKIIIVSGWNIDEEIKNKHDVHFVLQKPFTLEELEQVLKII